MDSSFSPDLKIFIVIPTYDESENVLPLMQRIFEVCPQANILIVDDNSPDMTWKVVQNAAERDRRIQVLRRISNRGRGFAGIAGFRYALDQGADILFEMDADFSHDPAFIPSFLDAIQDADLVSGSRFMPGGEDNERSALRRIITFLANQYLKLMLGLKMTDCTSGYRCFRRHVLEKIHLETCISTGPSILQEILLKTSRLGFRIREIPIVFVDRKRGKTKLTFFCLLKTLIFNFKLKLAAKNTL